MTPTARTHYARGLELYAARQYAAAIDELQRGYAVEPRREFLFAQAQAWRLSGNCERAVPLYQQFIESSPSPVQREAARLGLDRCAPERAAPPGAAAHAPEVAPAPPTPLVSAPRAPAPPPPPPWWRDPWGDVAIGAGLVALGTSAGFLVASNHARDQARSSEITTEREFDRLWTTARQRREIAVGALVGGAFLLAAGGARLAVVRGRESDGGDRAGSGSGSGGGGGGGGGSGNDGRGTTAINGPAAALALWGEGLGLTWRGSF